MTTFTPATRRRPWITPRVDTLATGQARDGLTAQNGEGLAKGS